MKRLKKDIEIFIIFASNLFAKPEKVAIFATAMKE